ESTWDGNSTQRTKPPRGRLNRVPGGNLAEISAAYRSTCDRRRRLSLRRWWSYPPARRNSAIASWGSTGLVTDCANFNRSIAVRYRPGAIHPTRYPGARVLENDEQTRTSPRRSKDRT